jgi:hypothetical protein
MPIYQSMTIRNWNTTTTLLRMMDEASGAVLDSRISPPRLRWLVSPPSGRVTDFRTRRVDGTS